MSDSVLDRIRQNRNRAAVPPRNDALISKPQPAVNLQEEEAEAIASSLEGEDKSLELPIRNSGTSEELKAELAKLPETQRHSAIVLEKKLDQELTRYCKDNRITVEVFLEAAWTLASKDPALLQNILDEAKERYKARKGAGKLRRLITMLEGKS